MVDFLKSVKSFVKIIFSSCVGPKNIPIVPVSGRESVLLEDLFNDSAVTLPQFIQGIVL